MQDVLSQVLIPSVFTALPGQDTTVLALGRGIINLPKSVLACLRWLEGLDGATLGPTEPCHTMALDNQFSFAAR